MTDESIQVLKNENITRVISLNFYPLPPEQLAALEKEGIQFLWTKIKDYTTPTVPQLIESSEFIETNHGATLVYCGLGEARTGTADRGVGNIYWQEVQRRGNRKLDYREG